MSEIDDFDENCDSLAESLKIVISINNELVKTLTYIERINTELCKLVSNLNNFSFAASNQINKLQNNLA